MLKKWRHRIGVWLGIRVKDGYLRRIISCGGCKIKYRHGLSSLTDSRNFDNRIILFTREGKRIENPYIAGLTVKTWAKAANNRVVLYEPLPSFSNTVITFRGKRSRFELKPSRHYVTGLQVLCGDDVNIKIGKDFSISSGSIYCEYGGGNINIGNDCMLGYGLTVRVTDGHAIYDVKDKRRLNDNRDVTIGNHVWIAARANIMKGAAIADNSVVATSSLVNRRFDESNVIIAGMPAEIIRRGINWDRRYDFVPPADNAG